MRIYSNTNNMSVEDIGYKCEEIAGMIDELQIALMNHEKADNQYYGATNLIGISDSLMSIADSLTRTYGVDDFLKWHDDATNYQYQQDNFEQMYAILDKYGSEDEAVDEVFKRATPEDQKKMLDLIRPR